MPIPGKTTERGYGRSHQLMRKHLLPLAYGTPCPRCGEIMLPGQALDLGHKDDDRTEYSGIEHASCNRRAGSARARRGHARQSPVPLPRTSSVDVDVADL